MFRNTKSYGWDVRACCKAGDGWIRIWKRGRVRILIWKNGSDPDSYLEKWSDPDPYLERERIRILIRKKVRSGFGLNIKIQNLSRLMMELNFYFNSYWPKLSLSNDMSNKLIMIRCPKHDIGILILSWYLTFLEIEMSDVYKLYSTTIYTFRQEFSYF